MKYIIFLIDGLEYPVIFSPLVQHVYMANKIRHDEILSAGFLKLDDNNNLYTTGRSVSLKVKSEATDLDLIKGQLHYNL